MFKLINELFCLLTPDQKRRFYSLQIMVVLMAIAEIIGIASIVPFMTLVGDVNLLQEKTWLYEIYQFSGINSEIKFIIAVGLLVLLSLASSAIISMLTTWRLAIFANKVGAEIGNRLYIHYLDQSWLFHANVSTAQLIKSIANETTRLTGNILLPLMQMNARLVLVLFIFIALVSYDPMVAICGLVFFAVSYFVLYKLVRKRLQKNSKLISKVYEGRIRLMNEGFGGIKDLLLLGRTENYKKKFIKTGVVFAESLGTNTALANVPRYFMELVAFGSMIALVLYLLIAHENNLGMVLPLLSVYALAAFKLLPAFQQIYNSMAQIKGNSAAFDSIKYDMFASKAEIIVDNNETGNHHMREKVGDYFVDWKRISLQGVSFSYPGTSNIILSGVSIDITRNSVIGIVGSSGSGKSTLIDIILSLIEPSAGRIKIDDVVVDKINKKFWQNNIGFVPQSIFLSEGTIAENIAFGISEDLIDFDKINRAIKLAHLEDLVAGLPDGLYTKTGERGVKLSGGQRQRIGIARALYSDPSVLIFDEATSALDGITEKMVMDAIHDFAGNKTIILIAHRLSTVKKCDCIYMLDEGEIVDSGSYADLLQTNMKFQKMVDHS